jgi:hypothetical protein
MIRRLSRLTWRTHRHATAVTTPGVIELDGQGERVDLELCACYAWRQTGHARWHGSRFRRPAVKS